jgi:ABC-type sugar transport system ATPase subunit
VTALRHVDLCICAGDSSCSWADNGSGKSTLLQSFGGAHHPQQGTYRFDGDLVDERSMHVSAFY